MPIAIPDLQFIKARLKQLIVNFDLRRPLGIALRRGQIVVERGFADPH